MIATALLELGVYFLADAAGATPRRAVMAALAAATVWVALAAAPLAAGPHKGLDGLLRGGLVADTSGLALLALWLMGTPLTFLAAVKIYCILGSMALAAITVVRLGRTRYGRACLAGITATLMMFAASTPFWANGLMVSLDAPARTRVVAWCVRVNPFFAIADATASSLDLIWHEAPRLYAITELGDRVAAPRVHWVAYVVVMLTISGIALAARLVRPPAVSRTFPDNPPATP
jgi:hypothetical protein